MVSCTHSTGVVAGSLTAALPASADVTTEDRLQGGMIVPLLQMRPVPVTLASSTLRASSTESSTKVSENCMARGVLQPDALLDGVTRE